MTTVKCERCGLPATPTKYEERPHRFPEQCVTALLAALEAMRTMRWVVRFDARPGFKHDYYVLLPERRTTVVANPDMATRFLDLHTAEQALRQAQREWPREVDRIRLVRRVARGGWRCECVIEGGGRADGRITRACPAHLRWLAREKTGA